ncbi:hypothetical protein PIB30_090416 [Stylosanthes scabra]|uniref:Ubiquitin-like protease family profile domain-containing protein n=1 Tax=Stylosanthes scabra TaxID=79078 RepID=A0ABU6SUY0_9FABA|nr:hypothetical protein [Stylosanthes scabra]
MRFAPTHPFSVHTPNVPEVLQHTSEKAKTESSNAKTGPRHIINQINLPRLELPIRVPLHFKPTAAMGLDYDELAVAAYLYGNTLMYNDEDELVLSYGTRAHRNVFRILLPDTQIHDEVITLVAEMMTSEMRIKSGYWFLLPYFSDSQRTRMDPCSMGFLITEICLGKVEDFKRVFIPVSEINKEGRKHWYLVVVDRLARQVILLDLNPTKCQDRRRRTATKLATYLEDVLDPLDRYYDNETTPTFSTIGYDFLEPEGISKLKDEFENNSSTEKVTLVSLANSIEQLSRQFQSLVQCLEDSYSTPSKVFKVFGSTSKTPNVPEVLQHISEKAKTESSNAKTGPRHIINQINLPGLERPIRVPVHFKPSTAMGLDYDELAVAAYLYGNTLMYNDEDELVLSYGTRAHRNVFRSLLPDTQIHDEVLTLVAEMMISEMRIESGYWFLPPYFAATYLEDVLDPLNRYYDNGTTPTFSTIGYDFLELEGISKLKDESNDAGVWVATWMMTCIEASNFNIKVDDVNRMKIAVSLVLKDHNIIEHSIKTKAIENLQLQDREDDDIYYN